MKPAAPVTRMRIEASLVTRFVVLLLGLVLLLRGSRRETPLDAGERVGDLRPLGLEALCPLEVPARRRAASELEERQAEGVVGVALGRVGGPGAAQANHRALQQRERG